MLQYSFADLQKWHNLFVWNLIGFGQRTDHLAGHTRSHNARRYIVQDYTASTDDAAFAYGYTGTDRGIGTNPDLVFDHDGGGGAQTLNALLWVDGMACTADADAGGNHHPMTDMHRRGVEYGTAEIDDGKTVEMDIEPIVTVEGGTNQHEATFGVTAHQLLDELSASIRVVGVRLIEQPAEVLCFLLIVASWSFDIASKGLHRGHGFDILVHILFVGLLQVIGCRNITAQI